MGRPTTPRPESSGHHQHSLFRGLWKATEIASPATGAGAGRTKRDRDAT